MARLTTLQKAERTLKLLLGMRIPRVAQHLEPYGFRRATLEEGWARLKAIGLESFEPREQTEAESDRPLAELDAFENTWFPIARGSLSNRYPEIAERLFENIFQTRGVGTAITVVVFLDRLAAMERGEEPYGADGPAARCLLGERGLTKEKEAAARDLLRRLREVESAPAFPALSPEKERLAVEAMWGWYLEWSAIARVAIKNKTLLKALGFAPSSPRSPSSAEPEPRSRTLVTAGASRALPPDRTATPSHQLGPNGRSNRDDN